jgi:hypothetical protein
MEVPAEFDHDTAQALGKLVDQVVGQPNRRKEFRENPIQVAEDAGVTINDTMGRVILTLAEMSPSELRLLSEFNRFLIAEGLYVETGNPPLMVF